MHTMHIWFANYKNLFALMSAGNVWFEQDRFGKKVALNTKIVPVDNDSFSKFSCMFLKVS